MKWLLAFLFISMQALDSQQRIIKISNLLKEAYDELALLKKENEQSLPSEEKFQEALQKIKAGALSDGKKILVTFLDHEHFRTIEAFYWMGHVLFAEEDYAGALNYFNEFVMKVENSGSDKKYAKFKKAAYMKLISCFAHMHKTDDLCAIVKKAMQEFPDINDKMCSLYSKYGCKDPDGGALNTATSLKQEEEARV